MPWKSIACVALVLVACATDGPRHSSAAEPAKEPIDIEGEYQYSSWNAAEQKGYKGPVIVTKVGEYYQVRYDNKGLAVGILSGNTFSVSYVYSEKPDNWGLEVLTVEKGKDGPTLTGVYTTHPGTGKLGKDTWTFVKRLK